MATYFLYSDINEWATYTLSEFLQQKKNENLVVRINSNGGNVNDGIAMYNLLQNYRGQVTTVVDGACYSAAVLPFLAGDKRYMNPGSTLLLHNVSSEYIPSASAEGLRKHAETIEQLEKIIIDIYMQALGKNDEATRSMLTDMMNKETLLTAEEAAKMGFCEIPKQSVYIDKSVMEFTNHIQKTNEKLLQELERYKKQEIEFFLQDVPEEAKKAVSALAYTNMEEAKKLKDFILKNAKPPVFSQIQQNSLRNEWTLDDWRKKDPNGLEKLKNENPEYFKELLKKQ
ncbi:MAG: Clp protease ClpP [Bacteroidia bacterium]|nr:Clp protease ClpP [Bacteroidia bacterium]